MGEFFIRDDYKPNLYPLYFVDDPTIERGVVFQPDVYALAVYLADRYGCGIVDVGCGYADKLAAIHDEHPDMPITGIDYQRNYDWARSHYPWGTWHDWDLEQDHQLDATGAIVVCADVIEHLVDPAPLMRMLAGSGATAIVMSTPEREVCYGTGHHGPPPNYHHVREWNTEELRLYVESCGLTIHFHGLTRGSSVSWVMSCQLLVLSAPTSP